MSKQMGPQKAIQHSRGFFSHTHVCPFRGTPKNICIIKRCDCQRNDWIQSNSNTRTLEVKIVNLMLPHFVSKICILSKNNNTENPQNGDKSTVSSGKVTIFLFLQITILAVKATRSPSLFRYHISQIAPMSYVHLHRPALASIGKEDRHLQHSGTRRA